MIRDLYKKWSHYQFQKKLRKEEEEKLPERKKFYEQFIKPGDLVFDIGANVGNRTNVFLELGARVVAVEPQPYCIRQLEKRFGNRIKLEPVGLGSKIGKAEMSVADVANISSLSSKFIQQTSKTRFASNKWDKKISIQIDTLDNLISKFGEPQFCKIDVEGYEPEVLKGLHQALPCFSFEYCVPEMAIEMIDSINLIHHLNPGQVYNYSTGESMNLALNNWVNYENIIQIVKTKEFTSTLFGDIYCKK